MICVGTNISKENTQNGRGTNHGSSTITSFFHIIIAAGLRYMISASREHNN